MAVPSGLKAHLFAEHSRAQFVLFAEVHEANARSLQSLDQLDHVALRLVLHRHHADEYLQ